MRKAPRRVTLAVAVALALWVSGPVYSFNFEPITQDFSPSGSGATQSFVVTNTENRDIAVKISMVTRQMDETGHETYKSASDRFIVFPSQIVLRAGASQTVRVRWKGPADIKTEQSYRIIAEQLPVNFGDVKAQGGSINILFRYLGAVYIVPPDAHSDIVLSVARVGKGPDGDSGLFLTFQNKGTAHGFLNGLKITIGGRSAAGAPIKRTLESSSLKGVDGANLLAGSVRKFFLPVKGELPEKDLNVDFSVESTR